MIKRKKLFISQPMAGKTREEIEQERERAYFEAMMRVGEPLILLDSYNPDCSISPLQCLSRSLGVLARADYAYFVPEWQNARGCVVEHMCAELYDIQILEEGKNDS